MTALGKMAPQSVYAKILFQTTVHNMDKHIAISPDGKTNIRLFYLFKPVLTLQHL